MNLPRRFSGSASLAAKRWAAPKTEEEVNLHG